jgi:hypothetical protein
MYPEWVGDVMNTFQVYTHAGGALAIIGVLGWMLGMMTQKFLKQRDITDELNEVRLRYKFMLNELAALLDEERQQFIDLDKKEDDR